jgi:hypothetical protein
MESSATDRAFAARAEKPDVSAPRADDAARRGNASPAPDRPMKSYAALMTIFNAGFGGALYAARNRLPDRFDTRDIALMGIASHKLSRLITKEKVTEPLREPFAKYKGEGPPAEIEESPIGRGPKRALGELLTCPYCVDQWLAAGFTASMIFAPRPTRAVASMLATVAVADACQIAYRAAQDATKN